MIAAGMTYKGKEWTIDYQIKYYERQSEVIKINSKINSVILEVYYRIKENGINNTLKPKVLKKTYNKYVNCRWKDEKNSFSF